MLQMTQMVQLIIFALIMSTGQFLFKKTAISLSAMNDSYPGFFNFFDTIARLIQIPWFYIAIFYMPLLHCFGYIFFKGSLFL